MPVILKLAKGQTVGLRVNSAMNKARLSRAFYSLNNMQLTRELIHRSFKPLLYYG